MRDGLRPVVPATLKRGHPDEGSEAGIEGGGQELEKPLSSSMRRSSATWIFSGVS